MGVIIFVFIIMVAFVLPFKFYYAAKETAAATKAGLCQEVVSRPDFEPIVIWTKCPERKP